MISIKDVAKACNVSAMTVSRALNDSKEISQDTRQRILKVCAEMGYKPNAAAKSLITKKTNMIGLIIPDITNQYYAFVSKGVSAYLESEGYGLILCNSDRKKANEKYYLSFLAEGRVDGIIILPVKPKKEDYVDIMKSLPMIMADNYAEGLDANFVANDNYVGGRKIISHMMGLGYKKIGVLLGDKTSSASNERFRAYLDVMQENGMEIDKTIVIHSDATFEDGYNYAPLFIERGADSIFAINDTVAFGVMKYCFEKNINIPKRLAVAGYDNIEQSSMLPVPLTTVHQRKELLGRTAAEVLIKEIKGLIKDKGKYILEPKLIIRKSCGEK
jgi:LacI family transcriptional regulator